MLTKNNLQQLAQIRLEDAIHLLQYKKASSAYYLAGYAVELALKACSVKLFQNNIIPDKNLINAVYTHSVENLMATSGLLPKSYGNEQCLQTFYAQVGQRYLGRYASTFSK